MNILVTGAAGFSGRHLVAYLRQHSGHTITGIDLPDWDLRQPAQVEQLLRDNRPEAVYHLAGSMTNDFHIDYDANVAATYNLLREIANQKPATRILLIGSAAEYGLVAPDENPVREDHPLQPVSVYGMTKVFQTEMMHYFHRRFNLPVVMARAFNPYGKGMSPLLFAGKLYQQIADFQKGTTDRITMGSLWHKRDFIPIYEAVVQYIRVMEHGRSGTIYNVGRGFSITCEELMLNILKEEGLPASIVRQCENSTVTPFDVPDIYADISALRSCG